MPDAQTVHTGLHVCGLLSSAKLIALNALCAFFACQPGDLLTYVPDPHTEGEVT